MEAALLRPKRCTNEKEIAKAMQDWEINKQYWYNIGGHRLQLEQECSIILRILVNRLRIKAVLDMGDGLDSNPEKLKLWAKE